MYEIEITKRAIKDKKLLEQAGLYNKVYELLKIIKYNPFQNPPPYEKLMGSEYTYSRRINYKHRLVYDVVKNKIIILQMWSHYE
ncbi:MAG: Txe/YoeB family addiction module toxin [Bacteroidetes bacterium]|nr:Txe/YoeB family addiction module toxin [Bacteroidota bacterium]